jgi:hypothetical protein
MVELSSNDDIDKNKIFFDQIAKIKLNMFMFI